jgi:ribokinase
MVGPRVVVVGSVNMDLVVTAPVLPRPGETVLGHDFTQVPGGKGANQAIASARAGGFTTIVGAIGSDAFGVTLRARLQASTVDTSLLRIRYGASGVALIVVDGAAENAIVVAPGANAALVDLTDAELAAIAGADVLLCQLEVPVETVLAAALAGRAADTRVVLDATPVRPLPRRLLDVVDLLVVNRVEATTMTGLPGVDVDTGEEVSADVLLDTLLESVSRAVVTQGADGAWYGDRAGTREHVPAPRVEAVDTTGAGDAFIGALAVSWGEGRDLQDAVRWASAAGAAAVRRLGASSALPQRPAIEELYATTYGAVG